MSILPHVYETSFIIFPQHCNHLKEVIFGGEFMAQLDLTAAHCVRKYLREERTIVQNAVTHKVSVEFHKPSYVGDCLYLRAEVVEVRTKALGVAVTATRSPQFGDPHELIASAHFVFITVGEIKNLESHPKFLPYQDHGIPAWSKEEEK